MNGTHPRATTSPIGWTALSSSGAWVKELIEAGPGGRDGFSLIRLAPGGRARITATDLDRFLVLEGAVELATDAGGAPARHHPGDYLVPPVAGVVDLDALGATALILRLTGRGLGGQTLDVFGPEGWMAVGPGVWAKVLTALPNPAESEERVVGVSYFEPGATSDRHPHRTSHRLLILEGDAEDEMIFDDGRRETASRRAGDFVDYPTRIEHRTTSRHGNLHLFVHEAVSVDDVRAVEPDS